MIKPIKIFLWVASLLIATLPVASSAQVIELQAEAYTAAHNIANYPISPAGSSLFGLDYPEEWTEYELEVDTLGTFSIQMVAKGEDGLTYALQLVFTAAVSGDQQVNDISFVGLGTA